MIETIIIGDSDEPPSPIKGTDIQCRLVHRDTSSLRGLLFRWQPTGIRSAIIADMRDNKQCTVKGMALAN